MATQTRAKFGYLNYEAMLINISQETNPKKKLDAYDLNFTPDTRECYIIAPDLTPWAIKSKVYTFTSVESAIEQLRQNTDTYPGQIIAIQVAEKYRGYIVNAVSDGWEVSPLSEHAEDIDYDTLGNKPIINLIGTLDNPIVAEELESGIYKIKGQYTISCQLETVFLSASDTLLIIKHEENQTSIKKITADEITDYSIKDDGFSISTVITSDFIKGYATKDYVDNKIAALDVITRDEVESYIQQAVNNVFDSTLDKGIDQKLDEKLQNVGESEIDTLF